MSNYSPAISPAPSSPSLAPAPVLYNPVQPPFRPRGPGEQNSEFAQLLQTSGALKEGGERQNFLKMHFYVFSVTIDTKFNLLRNRHCNFCACFNTQFVLVPSSVPSSLSQSSANLPHLLTRQRYSRNKLSSFSQGHQSLKSSCFVQCFVANTGVHIKYNQY